jgi:hypothetical protein
VALPRNGAGLLPVSWIEDLLHRPAWTRHNPKNLAWFSESVNVDRLAWFDKL